MATRAFSMSAILVTLLISSPLVAATWSVELDGTGNFTDIQSAVNAAAAGDTIHVGPGRFATFHPIGLPGYFDEVIVHVTKPNLTFIGSGKDVTKIGTTYYYGPYGKSPRAFFALAPNDFTLKDMTLENVCILVHSNADVFAESCLFRANDQTGSCISLNGSSGSVESCEFAIDHGAAGIVLTGAAHDFVIRDCHFLGTTHCQAVNCTGGPQNIAVSDCIIDDGTITFSTGATGSISRCSISSSYGSGIYITEPTSSVSITDVTIDGASTGINVRNSRVSGSRLTIANTTVAAINTSGRSFVSIHDSNFLPTSGWAVYCNVASTWPAHTLDLSNNNWGVTDAAAINALIWDHRDDPNNPCTVVYEPYIGQPVAAETTTWGDLKALFR